MHVTGLTRRGFPGACLHLGRDTDGDAPEVEVRAVSEVGRFQQAFLHEVAEVQDGGPEAFAPCHFRAENTVVGGGVPELCQHVAHLAGTCPSPSDVQPIPATPFEDVEDALSIREELRHAHVEVQDLDSHALGHICFERLSSTVRTHLASRLRSTAGLVKDTPDNHRSCCNAGARRPRGLRGHG